MCVCVCVCMCACVCVCACRYTCGYHMPAAELVSVRSRTAHDILRASLNDPGPCVIHYMSLDSEVCFSTVCFFTSMHASPCMQVHMYLYVSLSLSLSLSQYDVCMYACVCVRACAGVSLSLCREANWKFWRLSLSSTTLSRPSQLSRGEVKKGEMPWYHLCAIADSSILTPPLDGTYFSRSKLWESKPTILRAQEASTINQLESRRVSQTVQGSASLKGSVQWECNYDTPVHQRSVLDSLSPPPA